MIENEDIHQLYTFEKVLGEGAFGVVRKAVKKSTGEIFAVKIFNKENLTSEEELALQTEVEILTQIDHPNVVKLYEIYEDDDKFYMVLELMTGGELLARICEKLNFSEAEAVQVLRPILDALKYCHSMGVVHRDLKPENLLYSCRESGALLKISDFGLARYIGDNGVMMTQCGTPQYLAPEIIEGEGYTEAIDFWSFGVIIYIMLCGFPPFEDDDRDKLFNLIRKGDFNFPSPQWDTISQEGNNIQITKAKNLISSLLVTDSKKRLTCDQILQDPWFKGNISKVSIPNIQNSLQKFRCNSIKKYGSFLVAVNKWKKIVQIDQK